MKRPTGRSSQSEPAKKSQIDKFREAARAVETDGDEDKFNAALRKVSKADPEKVKKALERGETDSLAKDLGQTDDDVWHKGRKPSG